jgi:hypothetical protein
VSTNLCGIANNALMFNGQCMSSTFKDDKNCNQMIAQQDIVCNCLFQYWIQYYYASCMLIADPTNSHGTFHTLELDADYFLIWKCLTKYHV